MTVYFARAGTLVKIGHAINVAQRIEILQCGHPFPLVVVREVEGGRSVEAAFHRLFCHLRTRGEWFRWDDSMLSAEVVPRASRELGPAPAAHLDALNLLSARFGGDIKAASALKVSPQAFNNWRKRGISATQRPAVWIMVNDSGGDLGRDWLFVASEARPVPAELRSAA